MNKKKKRSPGQIFFYGFVRSLLFLAAVFAAALISYYVTYAIYDSGKVSYDGKESILFERDGKIEHQTICRNLIYEANKRTGRIEAMVLEIFNTGTNQLTYITIPRGLTFALSNELYKKLNVVSDRVPQIVKLGRLPNYFEGNSCFEYGEILLEDLFGMDISYYTALGHKQFHRIFKRNSNGTYIYRPAMKRRVEGFQDKSEISDYVTRVYKRCSTNCNLSSRLEYLEDYQRLSVEDISFCKIKGELSDQGFTADVEAVKKMISDLDQGQQPLSESL